MAARWSCSEGRRAGHRRVNDRVDPDLLSLFPSGVDATGTGALAIQGITLSELATRFGTPAYVVDEDALRQTAESFRLKFRVRRQRSGVAFASKSFPCAAVYRLMGEEGLHVDVAGSGELFLALSAGVAPAQIVLHGNAKTDAELQMAVDAGVGTIVLDGWDDIRRMEKTRGRHRVLLRVNPGVRAPTMAAISTGHHGSKFGMPLHEAAEAITHLRSSGSFELRGLHAHIGSQILELGSFADAIAAFAGLGDFDACDVGGGLGVRYLRGDRAPSIDEYLDVVSEAAEKHLPADAEVWIEPGRSLVAQSTFTLYRVVTVKHGGPTFVAVDGGIADNFEASTYVG